MSDIDCDIIQSKCVKVKRDKLEELAKSCGIEDPSKKKFSNINLLCEAIIKQRGDVFKKDKLDCNITDGKCNKTLRSDLDTLAKKCGIKKPSEFTSKLLLCEAIRNSNKKIIEEEQEEEEVPKKKKKVIEEEEEVPKKKMIVDTKVPEELPNSIKIIIQNEFEEEEFTEEEEKNKKIILKELSLFGTYDDLSEIFPTKKMLYEKIKDNILEKKLIPEDMLDKKFVKKIVSNKIKMMYKEDLAKKYLKELSLIGKTYNDLLKQKLTPKIIFKKIKDSLIEKNILTEEEFDVDEKFFKKIIK